MQAPMKITRQATADKLSEYLHGELTQAELVEWSPREAVRHGPMPHGERGVRASHWAERAMMDEEFEPADAELLSDIIGRLGLPEPALSEAERVAEFGLRWQDSEEFLRRLGYRATVNVSQA